MFNRMQRLPIAARLALLASGIGVTIPLLLYVRHQRMNYNLALAAEIGKTSSIRALLAAGADVDAPFGEPRHKPTSAHLLFATVPNRIYKQFRREKSTPLMLAVMSRQIEAVRALLDQGAKVDARDEYGYTALTLAISRKQPDIARLLLDRGANPNVVSEIGMPLLPWAVMMEQNDIARLLLERGADPNSCNSDGNPSLYVAVLDDNVELVRLLLEHGASPDAKMKQWSALRLAITQHNAAIADLLLRHHAECRNVYSDGQTPLEFAITTDQPEMIRLLKQAGAR